MNPWFCLGILTAWILSVAYVLWRTWVEMPEFERTTVEKYARFNVIGYVPMRLKVMIYVSMILFGPLLMPYMVVRQYRDYKIRKDMKVVIKGLRKFIASEKAKGAGGVDLSVLEQALDETESQLE